METISRTPIGKVVGLKSWPKKPNYYNISVDYWMNTSTAKGKERYRAFTGDIFILANVMPETPYDLLSLGTEWIFVSAISNSSRNKLMPATILKVKASKDIPVDEMLKKPLFLIYLANLTPNDRTFRSLHMSKNFNVIKEVLVPDPPMVRTDWTIFFVMPNCL